ncbi:GntR family transcriptional regulator [Radicibacter daui]|uniref:GntR family transcriptional regulator n=1 Tax=Radicibacter daui TaxID=3064829 RepID=UPI004046C74C
MSLGGARLADIEGPSGGLRPGAEIRRISVSQQIREALRERIVALEFVPGQHLSRAEIADFYEVSQTPVRDAMMKLEEEGLLVIHPQSKTAVSKIDVEQARETQFLRLSVELEVTRRLALNPDKKHAAGARQVYAQQEAAFAGGDLERFARFDRLFHQQLCEAAGVSNLWKLVTARSGHIDRLRNLNLPDPGKPANILHYHKKILDAIEAGDLAAAETAVREHLSGTLSQVSQIIARYPSYF